MRTPMLADSLVQAGHQVTWWTNSFCHFKKAAVERESETFSHEGIRYLFLQGLSYKRNISLRRYFHYKKMAWEFSKRAPGEERPDMIFASLPDYDLPFAAAQLAKKWKIPFIVDVRDLWPFEIKRQVFPFNSAWGKYLLSYEYYKIKHLLTAASAVTAVSKRMLTWAKFHRQDQVRLWDKVFYLGYPDHHRSDLLVDKIKTENEKITFVYVGSFNNQHNLDLIVETAERLQQEKYDKAHFLLIGDGEHYERIKNKSKWLANVKLTGWLDAPEIKKLLNEADVGLVPIKSGDYFLPNKPFEYLSSGLAILSTLKGDMSDFVEGHQVGLTCSLQDSAELGQYVRELTENHELRLKFSQNARKTFEQNFSAQIIYSQFVTHLEECWGNKDKLVSPN